MKKLKNTLETQDNFPNYYYTFLDFRVYCCGFFKAQTFLWGPFMNTKWESEKERDRETIRFIALVGIGGKKATTTTILSSITYIKEKKEITFKFKISKIGGHFILMGKNNMI